MSTRRISIIGAGFSGMSLAHECLKLGMRVEIYEASPRAGGLISSPTTAFGFYETAANAFLGTGHMEDFLKENQIPYVLASRAAKKRYIYRGHPKQWPLGFFETTSFLFNLLKGLLRGRAWLQPQSGESIQAWGQRCLGTTATTLLLIPGLQGIYAGGAQQLSASLILGPLFQKRTQKSKRILPMLSGTQGMGSAMQALRESLEKRGVVFHFGKKIETLTSDALVISTSAPAAAEVLEKSSSKEAQKNAALLKQVEMLPVLTATVFYQKPPRNYKGFGILFPAQSGIRALGLLMTSLTFNRGIAAFTETWIFGGSEDKGIVAASDSELRKLILEHRKKIFGQEDEILDFRLTRWPQALPHYSRDLERILKEIVPMKGIYLHGNYLGSIGLSRILEKSQALAAELARSEI